MNIDREQLKGHFLALLCAIAWGTSFLVSKNLMDKLTPVQLMFLRFVIAWLSIWVIYPKWNFCWREEGRFVVLALVGNSVKRLSLGDSDTYGFDPRSYFGSRYPENRC